MGRDNMINIAEYQNTMKVLYEYSWLNGNYTAFRLGANYNFSRSHTNYSNIKSHILGSSTTLNNKKIVVDGNNTKLVCDALLFSGDSINCNYIVIMETPDAAPKDSDRLLCYINLNNGESVTINKPVQFVSCGIMAIKRPE